MSVLQLIDGVTVAAAVTCFLAGLAVLKRWPADEVSHAYLLSSTVLGLLCLGLAADREALLLRSGSWMYLPVGVWWLATTFGRHPRRGQQMRSSVAAGLALLALVGLAYKGNPFPGPGGPLEATNWGRWVALIGVGFWLAAVVNQLLSMRGAVGEPRLRRAAGLGAFASLLPLWPETVTASTGALPRYSLWLAAALGVVAHLAWAEWLLRHRQKEGDLQFGRPVAYVSFAVFLLGVYLLLVGGVGKAVEWLGGDLRAFLSALGGVLLALLGMAIITSGRIWARLRGYVDRSLYRGEFDFRQDWKQLSEELAALPDPRDLGTTLSSLLSDRMQAETVFLYRRLDEGTLELWSRRGGAATPPERLSPESEWADWIWRLGAPADWATVEAKDKPPLLLSQTRLVVPLIAKQQIVALACLGGRNSPFTAEEKLWLEAAGHQAALAVLAANLTERLIETRELASFHRLSTFVIHDVKNAISMLSLLLQNWEQGKGAAVSDAARTTLQQATTKLMSLVDRFTGARDSVKPTRRALDLVKLVRTQIEKIGASFARVTFAVQTPEEVRLHGDPDQITRVIENLLINACEAMRGEGEVTVQIDTDAGGVELRVGDKGPGMDVDFMRERLFRPFATTKKKGLGIGLYQAREIARAHGGNLSAQSQPGEGATFLLWMPGSPP